MQRFVGHQELPGGFCRGLRARFLRSVLDLPDHQPHRVPATTGTGSEAVRAGLCRKLTYSCTFTFCGSSLPDFRHRKLSPRSRLRRPEGKNSETLSSDPEQRSREPNGRRAKVFTFPVSSGPGCRVTEHGRFRGILEHKDEHSESLFSHSESEDTKSEASLVPVGALQRLEFLVDRPITRRRRCHVGVLESVK